MIFPQLSSGALVQDGVRQSVALAGARIRTPGGQTFLTTDSVANEVSWDCRFSDLSEAETEALRSLYVACNGGVRTFTFVDPVSNLVRWSSDLAAPSWHKDPYLGVQPIAGAPMEGQSSWRLSNGSAVGQQLRQVTEVPGLFRLCFSVWMRGSGTALLRVAGGSAASELIRLSGAWRRSFVRAEAGSAAPVQVSVEVSGQSSMEVFGPQLEAQPHPSAYKVSGHRSGVYAKARFSGDRLLISHEGPGRFAARCSIVASQE